MKLNKTIEEQWYYRIGDNIEYFDPTKSYEITGYRPIDKENGVKDFDIYEPACIYLFDECYAGLMTTNYDELG